MLFIRSPLYLFCFKPTSFFQIVQNGLFWNFIVFIVHFELVNIKDVSTYFPSLRMNYECQYLDYGLSTLFCLSQVYGQHSSVSVVYGRRCNVRPRVSGRSIIVCFRCAKYINVFLAYRRSPLQRLFLADGRSVTVRPRLKTENYRPFLIYRRNTIAPFQVYGRSITVQDFRKSTIIAIICKVRETLSEHPSFGSDLDAL